MTKLFEWLKPRLRRKPRARRRDRPPRRRDAYYDSALAKEIERASPERAGELAGHPVERVDT